MRTQLPLFLVTWLCGGAGAVLGSMLGGAFGEHALFVGAMLGGVLAVAAAVQLAAWRGWVTAPQRTRVTVGAILGFAAAALIATRTLSSPMGPALSSLLIGVGAVLANRR